MIIVKQRDLKDCGVCSLASIIMFYGGYVPLEKIRLDTFTTKDGTNALNLIKAANKYGFDAYGIRLKQIDLFKKELILPAIAHITMKNGLNHFVVIYKISKNKLTIMDPAKGKVVMKKSEFLDLWTGVIIFFHPQQKILKYSKEKKLNHLFFSIIKSQKKLIIKLVWVSICLTIVSILTNYYFKIGLNAVSNNFYLNSLLYIILLFGCITIFKIIFNYLRAYYENHLNKNIDVNIFSDFLNHLMNLPLNVIQSRTVGEIVTRVNELGDLKILFTDFFITIFLDSILAITSMVLLFIISKELFFILCIALLLYLLIGIIFNSVNYQKIMQNIEHETDFNTTLIENINMFSSIKNLNTTKLNNQKIEESLMKYLKNSFSFTKFLNKQLFYKNFLNEISIFLINTLGFYFIYVGSLEMVDLVTFNSLMAFFMEPFKNTVDMLPKINYLKASYYKINDFLSVDIEVLKDDYGKLLGNDIVIENVSYSYNNYNYILKNLNINVKSKEHVFLKGPSGSGKSTICKLIYKILKESSGNILIGGVSISDYTLSSIRNEITYVSQNENIFTNTIRENIIFGRKIGFKDFDKVCKICKLDNIVAKRPLRYESLITDDTNYLSGGEKQRIILARALLKESKILLLDEALSEVDYKLEKEIIHNILDNYKDKTIIYVSHKDCEKLFDRTIEVNNAN